jgi:GMP synthase-like glutamine amidotransferase
MTKKIAVLLTNNDPSEFAKAFPNDGQKFAAKMRTLRPEWAYQVFTVWQGEFPSDLQDFTGYVITGSPASVNDPDDWIKKLKQFVLQVDAARLPLVGICFGHQAIAAALGGSVGRPDLNNNYGWGLGFATTHFTEPQPWMLPAQPAIKLLAAHCEQVLQRPPRARIIGSNAFCPNAAMLIDQHIFTTQYHPEMSVEFMDQLVHTLAVQLPAPVINQAIEQLAQNRQDDSTRFLQWIVNFFEKS